MRAGNSTSNIRLAHTLIARVELARNNGVGCFAEGGEASGEIRESALEILLKIGDALFTFAKILHYFYSSYSPSLTHF